MTNVSDMPCIERRNAIEVDLALPRLLLFRSTVAFLATALLVTIAYYLIDKPVALFVHSHGLTQYRFLEWLLHPAEAILGLAPDVLILGVICIARGRLPRWLRVSFAASLSTLVTLGVVTLLKVAFGRYWPDTWINDNPSLIRDGAYGFYPFHTMLPTAFPSGHAAFTLAIATVFWTAYPRWRWLYAALSVSVMVGLTGMNLHFVGDNIGGAFLGTIIGAYTSHFCFHSENLNPVP
jgi:membrane-associated phospholipid phosphatase